MKKEAFDTLEIAEGSWWDRGRQLAVHAVLRGKFSNALDFGAGFGSQLTLLQSFAKNVYAFEPDPVAQGALASRHYTGIYPSPESALSQQYDLIALLDVLEHIKDDRAILKQIFAALGDNGLLIITVPAYQWLWSKHDTLNMHFRRYTKRELRNVLEIAGFDVEYIGYWNMSLLIPLICVRLVGATGASALNIPRPVRALLVGLLRFESMIMRIVSLPFGISIIARARKKVAQT